MSRDVFTDRVQEWINEGATCSDCGHLLANHDYGWCYSCAKAYAQCGHRPCAADASPKGDE